MARVLLITPQMPFPPQQGTTIRNFNIIRGLAERHELALLSLSGASDQRALEVLRQYCYLVDQSPITPRSNSSRLYRFVTSRKPDMAHRLHSQEFLDILASLLKTAKSNIGQAFDVIQIEGLEMAGVIPLVRQYSPESRIVLDNHNAESSLQKRAYETDRAIPGRWPLAFYSLIQYRRLMEYERWAIDSSDYVIAVSEKDLLQILLLAPNAQASVIPNSIDITEYDERKNIEPIYFDLLFVGKMDYRPNVDAVLWFTQEIWPKILRQRAQTTLAIVGQKPHKRVESLQRLDGVTITGKVDSVRPYLTGASIVIMPFRIGSGTRLKLIEAAASSKAVVSTTLGAEGFNAVSGRELMIADRPEEFAEKVVTLMANPDQRQRLGVRARAFAADFDYRQVNTLFDDVYNLIGLS